MALEPNINSQETYIEIKNYIIAAKQKINKTVNSTMVEAYWNIGKKYMKYAVKMNEQNMENKF